MVNRKNPDVPAKQRDSATSWTDAMDDVLIREMLVQTQLEQKKNGNFTPTANERIVNALNQHFKGINMTKKKVKAHTRTLKTKFAACYDIFKNGHLSGFSWNPTTFTFDADPEVWKSLIERNNKAQPYMNKPFRNYDKLEELWGLDRTNGDEVTNGFELQEKYRRQSQVEESNNGTKDEEINISVESNNNEISQVTPTKQNSKRRRSSDGDLIILGEIMRECTSSMIIVMRECSRVVTSNEGELFEQLKALGLEGKDLLEAYSCLIKNADVLFGFTRIPVDHRKEWMLMELQAWRNRGNM